MKKIAILLSSLLLSVSAFGATFNLFTPATGVLKGNAATYVTTAALNSDIYALWTGTCSNTTYLRGDGVCATPPGAGGGTVNSVGLSAPSVFSVGGSPVTNSGVLALTFATGQTANSFLATPDGTTGPVGLRTIVLADLPTITVAKGGTGATTLTGYVKGSGTSAFTASATVPVADISGTLPVANGGTGVTSSTGSGSNVLSTSPTLVTPILGTPTSGTMTNVTGLPLTSGVTGLLPVANGGIGIGTLTGIAKGNGTSAFSVANSGDVIATWGGSCSASTYLRGDGSCQTPPTGGTGANPSATIGLTTVNGAASTYMRSDAAPALSQAITPTWIGNHTFNPASGVPVTITGVAATGLNSLATNGTTTGFNFHSFTNTGGSLWAGLENSTGGSLFTSAPAYAGVIGTTNATSLALATNGATRITVSSNGNYVVRAPVTGTTQELQGIPGTTSLITNRTNTTTGGMIDQYVNTGGIFWTGLESSTGGTLFTGTSPYAGVIGTQTATPVQIAPNGTLSATFPALGGLVLAAPTGGVGITVNGASGGAIAALNGVGSASYLVVQRSATNVGFLGSADSLTGGGVGDFAITSNSGGKLVLGTNIGTSRLEIGTSGNIAANAASSGTTLTINATNASTAGIDLASGNLKIGGSAGTAGQVLTSQGASAAPTWTTVAGSASGTFTATLTGMTATCSDTMNYIVAGNTVTVYYVGSSLSCTSNTTAMQMTGLPGAIQPAGTRETTTLFQNAGARIQGIVDISSSMTFFPCGGGGTYSTCGGAMTNTGSKGLFTGWSITYAL